jgi:hypothetical protein
VAKVITLLALLAVLATGCLSTRHIEQTRVVRAGPPTTAGEPQYLDQASYKERAWVGPWLTMPDKARP